jgi:P-type Cu+ transporter
MAVDKGKAETAQFEGKTFYFCSDHCKATFEANPHRYAHGARRAAGSQERIQTS